jgi:hypothetical protein
VHITYDSFLKIIDYNNVFGAFKNVRREGDASLLGQPLATFFSCWPATAFILSANHTGMATVCCVRTWCILIEVLPSRTTAGRISSCLLWAIEADAVGHGKAFPIGLLDI